MAITIYFPSLLIVSGMPLMPDISYRIWAFNLIIKAWWWGRPIALWGVSFHRKSIADRWRLGIELRALIITRSIDIKLFGEGDVFFPYHVLGKRRIRGFRNILIWFIVFIRGDPWGKSFLQPVHIVFSWWFHENILGIFCYFTLIMEEEGVRRHFFHWFGSFTVSFSHEGYQ